MASENLNNVFKGAASGAATGAAGGPYGALIGAGLGAVTSIFQNKVNASKEEKQREMMMDMYNRTNRYNSYAEDIKRMREAGLNPAYMFSAGDAGQGSASQASLPGMIPADYSGINNSINGVIPNILGQEELKIKQGSLENENQRVAMEQALNKVNIGYIESQTNKTNEEINEVISKVAVNYQTLTNLESQNLIQKEEITKMQIENDWLEEEIKARLGLVISEMHLNEAKQKECIAHCAKLVKEGAILDLQYSILSWDEWIKENTQNDEIELSHEKVKQAQYETKIKEYESEHPEGQNPQSWTNTIGDLLTGLFGVGANAYIWSKMIGAKTPKPTGKIGFDTSGGVSTPKSDAKSTWKFIDSLKSYAGKVLNKVQTKQLLSKVGKFFGKGKVGMFVVCASILGFTLSSDAEEIANDLDDNYDYGQDGSSVFYNKNIPTLYE